MNILLISASPRGEKSVTYKLAAEAAKGARAAGAEVETVQLAGKKLAFCHACETCHRAHMTCHIKDDAHHIILKMLNADGIIFATPNYIDQVTAPLKALLDRTSNLIHCQRLRGKYAASVVTSGSGNNAEVDDYLAHYARICGAQMSGALSCGSEPGEDDRKDAFTLGSRLAGDIKEKTAYPEQMKAMDERLSYFAELIKSRKDKWDGEYHYYEEKGWLDLPSRV